MGELDKRSRFPKLGNLSVSILEHLVEPFIGKDAIVKIKEPSVEQDLVRSIAQAFGKAEQRFISEYRNSDMSQGLIALPLSNLPSVVTAVLKFYSQPTDNLLEQVLVQELSNTFPKLSKESIEGGVKDYLRILREELITTSPDYRQFQGALASIRVENNTQNIALKLHSIMEMIAEFLERDKEKDFHRKISWRLSKLKKELQERKNTQILMDAIFLAEVYHKKGFLDESIEKLIENAYKAYFDLVINPVELIRIDNECQAGYRKLARIKYTQKDEPKSMVELKSYLAGLEERRTIESFRMRERVLACVDVLLPNHLLFVASILEFALELPLRDDPIDQGKNSDMGILKTKLEWIREQIKLQERELRLY